MRGDGANADRGQAASITFRSPSPKVRLILANANRSPAHSLARARRLVLHRDGPEMAAATVEYALDVNAKGPDWELGTAATRCRVEDGGLSLASDRSAHAYQLMTPVIDVEPGTRYVAEIGAEVTAGTMSFGVLDVDTDRWSTPFA